LKIAKDVSKGELLVLRSSMEAGFLPCLPMQYYLV
jgi:hypothetical protein